MEKQETKKVPKGLVIIKYLYALIAVCFGALIVFTSLHKGNYINIAIWDNQVPNFYAVLIISVLVLFPLMLYLGFSRPSTTVWYLAFLYHFFFIGNSILDTLSILFPKSVIEPMLRISGGTVFSSTATKANVFSSSLELILGFNFLLLLGLFVLFYLWQQKEYFMPKKLLKKI